MTFEPGKKVRILSGTVTWLHRAGTIVSDDHGNWADRAWWVQFEGEPGEYVFAEKEMRVIG